MVMQCILLFWNFSPDLELYLWKMCSIDCIPKQEHTEIWDREISFPRFLDNCSVRFILSINFHQICSFYNTIEVKTSDFFLEFVQSLFLNTVNRLIERALIVAFVRVEGQESVLIFRQPVEDGGKLKDEGIR